MTISWVSLVKKKDGEKLRQLLLKNSLLNHELKIQSEGDWLIFPLMRELEETEKQSLRNSFKDIRFEQQILEQKESRKFKDLFSALHSLIPENLHIFIPTSFDTIGNLVVIEIPEELQPFERLIGQTILELHPSIASVFKKLEPISGEFRLRNVQLLAGINKTQTIHKEYNCRYELDIEKVYFSPRLSTEHARVCSLTQQNEVILDMFAGIGPFSILIAKRKHVRVYAVDLNPAAIFYLKRNIVLNKVEEFITTFEGDVKEVAKTHFNQRFNRIIMNLPSKSAEFLDIATQFVANDGIIHYYQFCRESDYPTQVTNTITDLIETQGHRIKDMLNIRKVRAYAPHIWHIGVDILLE